jgi:riboflavin kinase/FMN adenylyltransferase
MRIFRHYNDVTGDAKGGVVAIGNFDGVHRGHQALIARARAHAHAQNVPLGILAFEPHPQEFFRPSPQSFRLTPFRAKARLLAEQGADVMYALAFDAQMAAKSAQQFVTDVLIGGLGVSCIVIGSDFQFGKGRAGNATTAGKPEAAAKLLGHYWSVESRVEHGDARGRTIGVPTANMRLTDCLHPAFGVYAVRATIYEDDKPVGRHDGVANFGIRPMYESKEPLLETWLFDFDGDLYGKHLAIEFVHYIRGEAKLDGIDALKAQIAKDAADARTALAKA